MKISITTIKGMGPHTGKPVRSPMPQDSYGHGCDWQPGKTPYGFRSTYDFSDSRDSRYSPTSKPGNDKAR